jgi:hypothetical protein
MAVTAISFAGASFLLALAADGARQACLREDVLFTLVLGSLCLGAGRMLELIEEFRRPMHHRFTPGRRAPRGVAAGAGRRSRRRLYTAPVRMQQGSRQWRDLSTPESWAAWLWRR